MGASNGKLRRPNGSLKGRNGCSPFYRMCGSKSTTVFYSKSLENCSFKLYRVDGPNGSDLDNVVVLLDCGGRVYANGKRVYPFENGENGTDDHKLSALLHEFTGRFTSGVNFIPGSEDKHVDPNDYALALDSLLELIAETFNSLLKDGLKLQEGIRILEEEKTALSLKVLELKRQQLHTQKLELEKKKLELRIQELEASHHVVENNRTMTLNRRGTSLMRSSSMGPGEGLLSGQYNSMSLKRTGSLRAQFFGGMKSGPESDTEIDAKTSQPKQQAVTRLKELEARREEIKKQSSILQFQLDALTAQHEQTETSILGSTSRGNSPKRTISLNPVNPDQLKSNGSNGRVENGVQRSSLASSLEKISSCFGDGTQNGDSESSWEKYDTLKKRYAELKKQRAQRLTQGGYSCNSQDDTSMSIKKSPKRMYRLASDGHDGEVVMCADVQM